LDFNAWLDEYVRRLAALNVAGEGDLTGCTEAELDAIEAEFRFRLPSFYRLTLLRFGKNAGRLVDVSEMDFYYPSFTAVNRRIRSGQTPTSVPSNGLVVRSRYDEVFEYVLDGSGDDAVVYFLDEDGEATPYYPSLTVWLEALLPETPLASSSVIQERASRLHRP
jgi:hypothetical protein